MKSSCALEYEMSTLCVAYVTFHLDLCIIVGRKREKSAQNRAVVSVFSDPESEKPKLFLLGNNES